MPDRFVSIQTVYSTPFASVSSIFFPHVFTFLPTRLHFEIAKSGRIFSCGKTTICALDDGVVKVISKSDEANNVIVDAFL